MTHRTPTLWLLTTHLLWGWVLLASAKLDPSDFLLGAKNRPRLEIIHPTNGQVLDTGDLKIQIKISGYDIPSNFHSSKICVGISTGFDFAEQCFQQSDLVFHANNLSPGLQYALRVVLLERNQAIAVSVRHFRVAGVKGLPGLTHLLTIKTAVQLAIDFHTQGQSQEAEKIYRSILAENPIYPDALHLLGMLFYQKGDALTAKDYVERAIAVAHPPDTQAFHTTLGVCYKRLGREEEAVREFRLALIMKPDDTVSMFNLGVVLEQGGKWAEALSLYKQVNVLIQTPPSAETALQTRSALSKEGKEQSAIRECDLLQALGREEGEALRCWAQASLLYPNSSSIWHELGTLQATLGDFEEALEAFYRAGDLGRKVSYNIGLMHEQLGEIEESRSAFDLALLEAERDNLPRYFIKIRRASLMPRIFSSPEEMKKERESQLQALDELIVAEDREVDNASPVSMSYSLGFMYLFQNSSNVLLKSRLSRLYLTLCPALSQGYFVDSHELLKEESRAIGYFNTQEQGEGIREGKNVSPLLVGEPSTSRVGGGTFLPSVKGEEVCENTSPMVFLGETEDGDESSVQRGAERGKIRVGFVSRFFHHHTVGHLVVGLLTLLGKKDEIELHIISIEEGGEEDGNDPVAQRIRKTTPHVHDLNYGNDLGKCVAYIRGIGGLVQEGKRERRGLDILIYPEISLDPLTYFMAHARIAPVQAAMLSHPDTTGLSTLDYFLSSTEGETLEGLGGRYTEQPYLLPDFGTVFLDLYLPYATRALADPSGILTLRQEVLQRLKLPLSAHLYVIPFPLIRIHPAFDQVIRKIVQHDRLGYVVCLEHSPTRSSLTTRFIQRVSNNTMSARDLNRIVVTWEGSEDGVLRVLQGAHVVLEPFPSAGTYLPSLQALAVGSPVICYPSSSPFLGGKMAYILYHMLRYGLQAEPSDLYLSEDMERVDEAMWSMTGKTSTNTYSTSSSSVKRQLEKSYYSPLAVSSLQDYVNVALKLTHQPLLRDFHSYQILRRRERLFQVDAKKLTETWLKFFTEALANKSEAASWGNV